MPISRLAPLTLGLAISLAGCITESASPAPSGGASPSSVVSASIEPTDRSPAEPTPTPTPEIGSPPFFNPGETVETVASGIRVRLRPGVDTQILVQALPIGADLIIAMGPVNVDDYGWYLVHAAQVGPEFTEGWVASGFEPDPWLARAVFTVDSNPYLGGAAGEGDGEAGPVILPDSDIYMDWIAVPPGTSGCIFDVALSTAESDPVTAVHATLGATLAPGRLQSQFFAGHPELTGPVSIQVSTACKWALVFVAV